MMIIIIIIIIIIIVIPPPPPPTEHTLKMSVERPNAAKDNIYSQGEGNERGWRWLPNGVHFTTCDIFHLP